MSTDTLELTTAKPTSASAPADDTDIHKRRSDADGAWKEILQLYLPDFFAFFWPEVHAEIDWLKPYVALEQEMLVLEKKEQIGKRAIDKLFQVWLKNGTKQWVLCHCEIQNEVDTNFDERMLIYFYRIFDRYKKAIASFAILADSSPDWRPQQYQQQIWGSSITRTYAIAKLIDFKDRQDELRTSKNPFALVVLAQLAATKTKANQERRLISKLELLRFLLNHGWNSTKIHDLYLFLDNLLGLNQELEVQYLTEVKQIEEKAQVRLTTTAERHGFANGMQIGIQQGVQQGIQQGVQQGVRQGIQQGVQQGESALLLKLLQTKFLNLPKVYVEKIRQAKPEALGAWGVKLMTANILEEIFDDQK